MKSLAIAAATAALLAAAPHAFAQTTATAALPPGGLTVGGPGFMANFATRTVFTAHTAMNICATVIVQPGANPNVTLRLLPVTVSQTISATAQSMTLCGEGETSVSISSTGGTVFWRVDRMN